MAAVYKQILRRIKTNVSHIKTKCKSIKTKWQPYKYKMKAEEKENGSRIKKMAAI